ncbi:MAG: hypothetical protein HY323_11590 [Betaproteobacteria bacterium]|nr:hypothetical protein [Betaproteobacteria bacterium]
MRAEEHWAKARRLETTRTTKLNDKDDYEIIIWSCIQGGAQLANVVLHKAGITKETFDLIHANMPELNREVPPAVAEMLAILKSIEDLGPRFVRGIEPIDPQAVRNCLAAYGKVRAYAEKLING